MKAAKSINMFNESNGDSKFLANENKSNNMKELFIDTPVNGLRGKSSVSIESVEEDEQTKNK